MDNLSKYKLLLADPPWDFETWSNRGKGRSAEQHYSVMTLEDICDLPVAEIADPEGSALFLWATYPHLEKALITMWSWGFIHKTTAFTWVKLNPKVRGNIIDIEKDFHVGLGYYTRHNPEICLLGTRGKILERCDKGVRNLVVTPRRKHSEKPREVRERIVQLFGDLPRIELFAREKVDGWNSIGFDIDGRDIRESLDKLITLRY